MTIQLTYLEAWADFVEWVYLPENWAYVSRSNRDQILKAKKAATASTLGPARVERILTDCRPGVYTFNIVVFKEENQHPAP